MIIEFVKILFKERTDKNLYFLEIKIHFTLIIIYLYIIYKILNIFRFYFDIYLKIERKQYFSFFK